MRKIKSRLAAYAACGWSVVFLVPHVYWAAGGTAGLPNAEPLDGAIATVNGAAIVLSVLAALLALALTRRSRTSPRRVLVAATWTACVVLSLRGLAGLGEGVVSGGEWSEEGSDGLVIAFETLFLAGGVLFGLAAREATTDPGVTG